MASSPELRPASAAISSALECSENIPCLDSRLYHAVSLVSRHGVPYFLSQSVNGLRSCARQLSVPQSVRRACTPQKIDPALIARFRPAMLGCFVPVDPTTPPAS